MLINSLSLQDSSGIFWDNDSLASLLAIELKADLLVLLGDVDGLYSGPPSEPQSKIIHTYIKEKHDNEITFGDKSRVGSGGMTAKVMAAFVASNSGTPVVITRYVLRLSFFSKRMITALHYSFIYSPCYISKFSCDIQLISKIADSGVTHCIFGVYCIGLKWLHLIAMFPLCLNYMRCIGLKWLHLIAMFPLCLN